MYTQNNKIIILKQKVSDNQRNYQLAHCRVAMASWLLSAFWWYAYLAYSSYCCILHHAHTGAH